MALHDPLCPHITLFLGKEGAKGDSCQQYFSDDETISQWRNFENVVVGREERPNKRSKSLGKERKLELFSHFIIIY